MCLYGIFKIDFKVHCFQGRKNTIPLEFFRTIVNMPIPTNPKLIQVFNGVVQIYGWFIKNFPFIMALITKLMRET
jgi:hypothetical protein